MPELTNKTQIDVVLDRKLDADRYGDALNHNFIASQELTVTITLSEYRELVESSATKKKDIDEANNDKYKREREIEAQKKENEALKAENYELKKKIDDLLGNIRTLETRLDHIGEENAARAQKEEMPFG